MLRWILIVACFSGALLLWRVPRLQSGLTEVRPTADSMLPPQTSPPPPPHTSRRSDNPNVDQWLVMNSNNRYAFEWEEDRRPLREQLLHTPFTASQRPKAAIISLVRNEELEGIMQSMRQLELQWNHKYRYPWIFLNDRPFSDEFKTATSNLTSAATHYETIPREHWSIPSNISEDQFYGSLDYLGAIGVGKGYMVSYRRMCRWNSMFFYHHPVLQEYDYYWRVEPDVHFFCDIPYDPFRLLRDNRMVYGFNMLILDDARSFPSLFQQTLEFADEHHDFLDQDVDLDWLIDPRTGEYNNCQFFSNFEIGDLNFFRGQGNERYVKYLDERGGFFYERFGDAPVHTLSLALFAGKSKIHFFRDIGYQHDIARHCPPARVAGQSTAKGGGCNCEPTGLDENFYKLVPMESPQWKPEDTCIRLFLGDEWQKKKEGWDAQAEIQFGGSGYGGYVREG